MPDGASILPMMQRSQGSGSATLTLRDGRVRLDRLHQSGSAKVMLPRIHGPVPEVVFLNTSGGLTGGDRLQWALTLGPGADVLATTQTAERAYASAGGLAEVRLDMTLDEGARLDWLPQETILFDGSALSRRTVVNLAGGARFLMAEMLVLGRAAMGETVRRLTLIDWREIRRDGRPEMIEPLRLSDAALGNRSALLGPHRAVATVAFLAPGAEDALSAVRAALPESVEAAASAWDGKCVVRLLAPDALPLKRAVASVLLVLRGRPLPRVWQI